MKTILVSGASGIVGYGILRSLRKSGKPLRLVGTSIYEDSVAPAFCDIFERAPPTLDPGYTTWLLDAIGRHRVDMIIPGIEIDMHEWARRVPEIERGGAVALLNRLDLIRLCEDKWVFYEDLKAAAMPCAIASFLDAEFDALKEKCGLPFLLKPRRGFGSKGIVRVDSEATFLRHRTEVGSILMAQPIVGSEDEEFTTSAFADGRGAFCAIMTLRRKLSRDGFTEKAEVVRSEDFVDAISKLCRRYRPVGPTNFQFRVCDDGTKLLEINPRISSSTSIRAAFGYNESAMSVDYFLDHRTPSQPIVRGGKAVRYIDEHIFYDDRVRI